MQQLLDQSTAGPLAATIKQLNDITQEWLYALNNIGIDTTSWDPILFQLFIKKLDRGTFILYERTITNLKEVQKIKNLLTFLENRFQSPKPRKIYVSTTSATWSLCKKNFHQLYRCQKFQQLFPADRFSFIRKQNLCVNCLKSGHIAKT